MYLIASYYTPCATHTTTPDSVPSHHSYIYEYGTCGWTVCLGGVCTGSRSAEIEMAFRIGHRIYCPG